MLTPLDAESMKFRNALSGYDRHEVEQFRDRVIQTLEEHIAQAESLRQRIANLEEQLVRYHDNEELLKNSVVLAQRTADELIAAAHQRADSIIQAAQLEGESIRRGYADLRSQREQFEYAFHGLLTGFLQRLEQGNPSLIPAPAASFSQPVQTAPTQLRAPQAVPQAQTTIPVAVYKPEPVHDPVASYPATPAGTNARDDDVSLLTAALDAVKPECDAATANNELQAGRTGAVSEESFALYSQQREQQASGTEEQA